MKKISCLVWSFASVLSADVLTVQNTNDSGVGSLRQNVESAQSGDEIQFAPSLNGETILLSSGALSVDVELVIDASSLIDGLTISGGDSSRIMEVGTMGKLTLEKLKLVKTDSRLTTFNGGAIFTEGEFVAIQCVFSGNAATRGGAIYSNSGNVVIVGCTFHGNLALSGGGAVYLSNGSLLAFSSTFSGNTSPQ